MGGPERLMVTQTEPFVYGSGVENSASLKNLPHDGEFAETSRKDCR